MTRERYREERERRGSMRAVAKLLGIDHKTIFRREKGTGDVSKEAEIAILSLPLKKD